MICPACMAHVTPEAFCPECKEEAPFTDFDFGPDDFPPEAFSGVPRAAGASRIKMLAKMMLEAQSGIMVLRINGSEHRLTFSSEDPRVLFPMFLRALFTAGEQRRMTPKMERPKKAGSPKKMGRPRKIKTDFSLLTDTPIEPKL